MHPAPDRYNPRMDQTVTHYLYADCGGRLTGIDVFDRVACEPPVCPGCGAGLVAVQGERRGWHFRHKSGGGCDPDIYEAACAALERRNARAIAARKQRREAVRQPAAAIRAGAPWEHPLIVGIGVLAAVSFLYLLGEARRG